MEKYLVKTLVQFDDYGGKAITPENPRIQRKVNDVFRVTKERYTYLKSRNLVFLVGIDKLK